MKGAYRKDNITFLIVLTRAQPPDIFPLGESGLSPVLQPVVGLGWLESHRRGGVQSLDLTQASQMPGALYPRCIPRKQHSSRCPCKNT